MKIAFVVGHERNKQGAWGNAGISEWQYNTILAKDLAHIATSHAIEARIFFRSEQPGGYGKKMKKLHKQIDEWGANISISLHFNAAGNTQANGHEILYCSKAGRALAHMLDTEFDKHLKNRDRNIKRRRKSQRGGGFLCRGKSACILVEPFFAAHQHRFISGTQGYNDMLKAYSDFFLQLRESN